ncbi:MAG: DNA-directed RNA polymerase subunit omega [Candidatus Aminicenantes bacterium]|nr:DNA-directed RNA polymerase subunit omega [Candidatus Aminicenantes bacterium]MDH5383554.1 DNA-directed RNA polymerase subunit omega [Candidatus Aminicenantes bacterium]MDH5743447.1 DNA-directed RNA polymerase subunit omega [Candidatus Aminicenantes bacterium]
MKNYGDVDSKFRFVILASLRAKQLLRGAKPLVKSRSKNLIRIAQEEIRQGLVDYKIVKSLTEEFPVVEEGMFIGEEIGAEVETDMETEEEGRKEQEKTERKKAAKKKEKDEPKKKSKKSKKK